MSSSDFEPGSSCTRCGAASMNRVLTPWSTLQEGSSWRFRGFRRDAQGVSPKRFPVCPTKDPKILRRRIHAQLRAVLLAHGVFEGDMRPIISKPLSPRSGMHVIPGVTASEELRARTAASTASGQQPSVPQRTRLNIIVNLEVDI